MAQARVQVKSRYATDCDRGIPVKDASLDAFDFLQERGWVRVDRYEAGDSEAEEGSACACL